MRYVGHRLFVGWAILWCGCVTADAQTRRVATWRQQVNPQRADREVLLRRVTFRVDRLGRVEKEVVQRQRVLTDRGADVYCDPRVTVDSTRRRLTVLRAQTRTPSRRLVLTPASGKNKVTPRALARAPAYAGFVDHVTNLLGIEPGAVTDHRYRIRDFRTPTLPFGARVPVGDVGPLKRLEVVVAVPAGTALQHACSGCPKVRPVVKRSGKRWVYRWTFKDLKPVNLYERRVRRRQPPGTDPLPQLVFTTAPTWTAALAPLRRRLSPHVTPAVAALAKRLEAQARAPSDRLAAALRYVTHVLRRVRFDALAHGLLPAPPATVLRRGYGHVLDRGALLLALLRALKMDARPVLLQRGPRFAPAVPTAAQLGRLWVEVRLGKSTLWLDPDRGVVRAPGAARTAHYQVVLTGSPKPTRITARPAEATKLAVSGQVSADGRVTFKAAAQLQGRSNPFSTAKAWQPKAHARQRKGLAKRLWKGAGKKSRVEAAQPGLLKTRLTAHLEGRLADQPSGLAQLRLPDACGGLKRVAVHRESPELPLLLPGSRLTCKLALTLRYPAQALVPLIRPSSVTVKNAVGRYRRVVQAKAGVLNVVVKLSINGPRVAPRQVASLRRLVAAARAEEAHLVVFRRLGPPPAKPARARTPPARR